MFVCGQLHIASLSERMVCAFGFSPGLITTNMKRRRGLVA